MFCERNHTNSGDFYGKEKAHKKRNSNNNWVDVDTITNSANVQASGSINVFRIIATFKAGGKDYSITSEEFLQ